MNDFTPEELKNISELINAAPIKGSSALTVALLQQKIATLSTKETDKPLQEKGEAPEVTKDQK